MLKTLFKPKWQSKSAEKRLAALRQLDPTKTEDLQAICYLIEHDSEENIQHAALRKITDIEVLYTFSQAHPNAKTKNLSNKLYLELIGKNSRLNIEDLKQFIAKKPSAKFDILCECPHADLRLELLRELDTKQQVDLIESIQYVDTRKYIAEQLSQEDDLLRARLLLKGKDKSTERIIKDKLDTLHLKQKQDKENTETLEKLCQSIKTLAAKDYWHQDIKNQFLLTEKRWQNIDFPIPQAIKEEFKESYTIVKRTIDKHALEKIQRESQKELVENIEAYCHELAPLKLQEIHLQNSSINKKLEIHSQHWSDLSESVLPTALLNKRYLQAKAGIETALIAATDYPSLIDDNNTEQLREYSKELKRRLNKLEWSTSFPPLQLKKDIEAELEASIKKNKKAQNDQQATIDKLHKRINRLLASTERGNVNLATRKLEALKKQIDKQTGKDKASLDKRLEKATETVGKMRDWKNFATEPKFIELCEQMEKLSTSKKNPEALAQAIKKLQDQWKKLGPSETANQHWERFKTAGDSAYAPCAIFFSERKARREKNLAARELILNQQNQLLEKTDWETLKDYKPIESELRSAMNAWQKIKDVEVKAGNKQWKRFNVIRDKLYARLDTEYDSNVAVKEELIKKVSALLEQDFSESKNEGHLKKLQYFQKNWKDVGITRRNADQKLWKTFKKTSDEVYAKIQGVRKSKRAEEDKQLNNYRTISKQIQSLAKSTKDIAQSDSQFEKLKQDYASLPPLPQQLPEKLIEGIKKDYQRACDAYQKAHDRLILQSKNQAWDVLAQKAQLCSQLEALTETDSEAATQLQQEIENLVVSDNELNRQFNKRLESINLQDRSQYSKQRRRLCIDLEILLGKDSPIEDKNLRRQIQLERMQNNGLGRSTDDTATQLKKIKLDWYCLPSAEANIQAELDARFKRLMKI